MARGIFKRKGSHNYWIRYAGPDGRIIKESSNSEKFSDAQALYFQRKREVRDNQLPERKKIADYTFRELAEKYKAWLTGRQKSAKIKGYIIDHHLMKYQNLKLKIFNTNLTEQLQTELMQKGLKNSSCNKILNTFKHMFSKAVEWEMVDEDILKRIRKVKLLQDTGKRLRYLSREECQALVNNCDSHLKPIVITALNTGMRRGEILNLLWDNVDLKHGFILLDMDMTKNGERREIPISDTLKNTLSGIMRRLDVSHIFHDPVSGKPYQEVKRSFHTALKRATIEKCSKCDYQKALMNLQEKESGLCPRCSSETIIQKGIRDFHFHDLRHTFASQLVMAGVDITTVKELLGHKDIKMTLRYAHLAPAHKVKAINILDETLNGQKYELAQLVAQSGIK